MITLEWEQQKPWFLLLNITKLWIIPSIIIIGNKTLSKQSYSCIQWLILYIILNFNERDIDEVPPRKLKTTNNNTLWQCSMNMREISDDDPKLIHILYTIL